MGLSIYFVNEESESYCDLTESIYAYADMQRIPVKKAVEHYEEALGGVHLECYSNGKQEAARNV